MAAINDTNASTALRASSLRRRYELKLFTLVFNLTFFFIYSAWCLEESGKFKYRIIAQTLLHTSLYREKKMQYTRIRVACSTSEWIKAITSDEEKFSLHNPTDFQYYQHSLGTEEKGSTTRQCESGGNSI